MSVDLPLIKHILAPLAKNVLIPLGLTAASAADAAIQKKMFGSGKTLLNSDEEMNDIMKIVKSFEDFVLLIKVVSEAITNKVKEQKGGFFGMLLRTLGTSLLGNMFARKGVLRARGGKLNQTGFKLPPHPLTNFEIQKYYQNEPKLNGIYSRNNLPKKMLGLM